MSNKPQAGIWIGLLVLLVIGVGFYFFIVALIKLLSSTNSDLAKALIAGAVTITVTVLTVVIGKAWEQRVAIRQDIRAKKVPVYEEQIRAFFAAMFAHKSGDDKSKQEELAKAFMAFTEKLIVWGSPEVIKAWSEFRNHNWQDNKAPAEGFAKLELFMRAIRLDLGNKNEGLESGELMKLFINDYQRIEQSAMA
jgi:hypothetical protein